MREKGQKITSQQIQKAKELYLEYTEGFNGNSMISAVDRHQRLTGVGPAKWKEEKYGKQRVGGISYSAFKKHSNMIALISECQEDDTLDNINANIEDPIRSFQKGIQRVEKSIKLAREYLNVPIPEEDLSNSLSGTKWAAYFSFYNNEGTNKINEGVIGRAIVEINGHSKENNTVTFTNTQLDGVKDYRGSYISHMDMYRGYVSFDLNADPKNPEKGRNIHIKVYCENRNLNLLLGQYTTYEKGHIQSGRIIFHNFKSIQTLKSKNAGAFSHFLEGCEDFNHDHIPKGCLKFLSVRSDSYQNDVFNSEDYKVNTTDDLENRLLRKRELDNSLLERFIERVKPKVFLAAAGASKTVISLFPKIKGSIEENFGEDNLYVSFKTGKLGDEDNDEDNAGRFDQERRDDEGYLQPFRDIEKLKRTRFFILFLEDTSKLSYSYLQLGIALTVAKIVVVVGKRSQMSNTIADMRGSVIEKIFLDDIKQDFNFSKDYPLVMDHIHHILAKNLPKKLKGEFRVDTSSPKA